MPWSALASAISAFFSNQWVVAIFGGFLSAAIFTIVSTLITKFFLKRKTKEYRQNVNTANTEVLYALRPLIPETVFPSSRIVDSVISATAKKHGISKEAMNTPMQFFDELMKEVMDSSFVAHKKKTQYCENLCELKEEAQQYSQPDNIGANDIGVSEKKEGLIKLASVFTGFFVATSLILVNLNEPSQLITTDITIDLLLTFTFTILVGAGFIFYNQLRSQETTTIEFDSEFNQLFNKIKTSSKK